MNNILMERMCKLMAQTYAIPFEEVWRIFSSNYSIDETLRIVQEDL